MPDTIQINRENVLEILQTNRKKHKKEFNKALKVWKEAAREALKNALKKADEEDWIEINPLKDLPKPKSYLDSYDSAIRKMELEVRPDVELDDREFAAWVEDNWEWRHAFTANSSLYTAS